MATDAERLQQYEDDFRHAGLPLFSEDISASEDIWNRAAPLLGLVFLGEMLGAGNLDWSWWQNLLAVAGGLAILLVAIAIFTDSTYREEFLDELTSGMRKSFEERAEYLKLRDNPASG